MTLVRTSRECGLSLGEPGAGRVGGRLAHLLHRRNHLRRVGDHLVPKGAANAGIELLDVGAEALRPPPRLEALLGGPESPHILDTRSVRALDNDLRFTPRRLVLISSCSCLWLESLLLSLLQRGLEAIEPRLPQLPVLAEPLVDLPERLRLQGVKASLPIRPHRDEPRLVKDAQVPRHAGLMDTCLLDDVTNLLLAIAKGLDDATARRIGECLKSI